MFDPKRAARVGAKKLRQRQDYRLAKKDIHEYMIDQEYCDHEYEMLNDEKELFDQN